jgi:hypothetical protein
MDFLVYLYLADHSISVIAPDYRDGQPTWGFLHKNPRSVRPVASCFGELDLIQNDKYLGFFELVKKT